MRYEDSMKGVAAQIIKEQQRASKIKNNPEEFHWHDEYATLNFFRFICKNIGNLGNGESLHRTSGHIKKQNKHTYQRTSDQNNSLLFI